MENFAWKENEAESIKHDPVRSLSYAFLDLYTQLQRSTICQSFSYSIMIYIIMYILTHEKIKFDTIVEHVKIVYYELKRIITSPSHMTYIYHTTTQNSTSLIYENNRVFFHLN